MLERHLHPVASVIHFPLHVILFLVTHSLLLPRQQVPVTYVSELSLLQEFFRLLPTLLLLGALVFFSRGGLPGGIGRGGMGGGGAGGGARSIFNVGKAQVTKMDKNSKNKVREGVRV